MYNIQYIQTYLATIILCGVIAVFLTKKMNRNLGSFEEIYTFYNVAIATICMMVSQSLWTIQLLFHLFPTWLVLLINALDVNFALLAYYSIYRYVRVRINRMKQRDDHKELRLIFALPLFAMIAINFSSIFTGSVFYLDESGMYQRGILYVLHMGVCLFYFALSWIDIGKTYPTVNKKHHKDLNRLVVFTTIPLLGATLQVISDTAPFTIMAMTLAFFIHFITRLEARITTDELTKLYNRSWIDETLSHRITYAKKKPFYLIMCDIDKFKQINDTYGHLAGDQALITLANTFQQLKSKYPSLQASRYGGDEFLLIIDEEKFDSDTFFEDCHTTIHKFQQAQGSPFLLQISFGICRVDENLPLYEDAIYLADERLYTNKQSKK